MYYLKKSDDTLVSELCNIYNDIENIGVPISSSGFIVKVCDVQSEYIQHIFRKMGMHDSIFFFKTTHEWLTAYPHSHCIQGGGALLVGISGCSKDIVTEWIKDIDIESIIEHRNELYSINLYTGKISVGAQLSLLDGDVYIVDVNIYHRVTDHRHGINDTNRVVCSWASRQTLAELVNNDTENIT